MKINFNKALTNLDGTPIRNPPKPGMPEETGKELTVASVAINALMNVDFEKETGEEKVRRYTLAGLIHKEIEGKGEVEMEPKDAALIKDLIAKGYGPIVVGQAWPLLNG